MENSRVLYFDIDGVMLDYDDQSKRGLLNGELEMRIKNCQFDRLVCLSGWCDIVNSTSPKHSMSVQQEKIYQLLSDIFSDKATFIAKLSLQYDTDHRCQYIDLEDDWYYLDDWADKFFVEAHGEALYQRELGKRVLRVDPFSNGEDMLDWFEQIAKR